MILSCTYTRHESEQQSNCCSPKDKIELLISKVISIPQLQQYYNVQEIISQKQLVIIENEHINRSIILEKFGLPVKILSLDEIKKQDIKAYLEFKELTV